MDGVRHWTCQHALTVANEVAVKFQACGYHQTHPAAPPSSARSQPNWPIGKAVSPMYGHAALPAHRPRFSRHGCGAKARCESGTQLAPWKRFLGRRDARRKQIGLYLLCSRCALPPGRVPTDCRLSSMLGVGSEDPEFEHRAHAK
jgi:hypothetical protein